MKRALTVTAALVAAVAVWTVLAMPPRPLPLDTSWSDDTLPGLIHIHTNRSDGLSDPETVAAAAARAGLKFVVFTDHGDGTRTPDPPIYRSEVLCLDGVEVSTTGGHYVVLDLGEAPYPLGGEPRDVVEDVQRLGGFGIAAHPDSPKSELAWHDWSVPVDGLEILNPDTSWRAHASGQGSRLRLLSAALTYPFRPTETIGALLTPSADATSQWTRLTRDRAVVGTAGVDAHANLALLSSGAGRSRASLPIPGYEPSFRALSVHVMPTGLMTGDAAVDGARLLAGIRRGQLYTAIDAWATPAAFRFTADGGGRTVSQGESIPSLAPVTLNIRHNGGDGFVSTVWKDDHVVADHRGEKSFALPIGSASGAYRVEIRDPRHTSGPAWITSNPIYLREALPSPPEPLPARPLTSTRAEDRLSLFNGRSTTGWTVEMDPSSLAAVNLVQPPSGAELRVRYGLLGGVHMGQFSGVAVDTLSGAATPFDRVTFTLRGERPMRLSLQVRADFPDGPPERWQRSVYFDSAERTQSVRFDDMNPVGKTRSIHPPTAVIRNVMFIVDTTNSKPGSSGSFWLKDVRLER